ncbi:MAG: hypothetical protein ACREIA_10415 [Opitutaceae bacterium]
MKHTVPTHSIRPPALTRRQFVGTAMAATVMSGIRPTSQLHAASAPSPYQLFWGDLHNHNAVGYAKGSLERSIDPARAHLDFFAFTGHASWHDMPRMPGDRHMLWVNGFKEHLDHWEKTRRMLQDAATDRFVALLGYEWHSSVFGDYCLIFDRDQPDLFLPDHVDKLHDFAESKGAMAIPHHLGYREGWRGANWKYFRGGNVSPVVEIMSEHGCAETERGPFDYIRHSLGGRWTANTVAPHLARGVRFGFVASSDDHLGYPGAYGEGVLGVWAQSLDPKELFEAIRARRTYASSGERIALEFTLNGHPMGAALPFASEREIDVVVEGQDAVEMVELVRNGRVIERHFPGDTANPLRLPSRAKCRIRYGWGPWGQLALDRVCQWDMTIRLDGGRFHRALGCFQNAPFGEDFRDKLTIVSATELHLQSPTARSGAFAEDPTKAIVCDLEARPEANLIVELRSPVRQTVTARLSDLIEENVVTITGGFPSESFIMERLVGPSGKTFGRRGRVQCRRGENGNQRKGA